MFNIVYICIVILYGILTPSKLAAQWMSERTIGTANLYPSLPVAAKMSCANFASEQIISCVYTGYSDPIRRMDLFEIFSINGGVSWSAPVAITNDPGDEYDPMIEYDSLRGRFNLVYAKWHANMGGNKNDIVIRHKSSALGNWSDAKLVVGDGINDYWIPSVLTLQNGDVHVYFTRNGPESIFGTGSGRIMLARSIDGGFIFSPPQIITETCDAEYPRAIQNSYGAIMSVFSRYVVGSTNTNTSCADDWLEEWPVTDIHQIWSSDGGTTWEGESTLYKSPYGSSMHPYVAAETTQRQNPCPSCQWSMVFHGHSPVGMAVFHMQSTNQGLTWTNPSQLSTTTWNAPVDIDAGFIIGCRGFFSFYTDGFPYQSLYSKRYDWSNTCSIQ